MQYGIEMHTQKEFKKLNKIHDSNSYFLLDSINILKLKQLTILIDF